MDGLVACLFGGMLLVSKTPSAWAALTAHAIGWNKIPQWDGSEHLIIGWMPERLKNFWVSHIANARWVGSRDFRLSHLEGIPKGCHHCGVLFRGNPLPANRSGAHRCWVHTGLKSRGRDIHGWWMEMKLWTVTIKSRFRFIRMIFYGGILSPVGRWSRSVDE